MVAIFAEGTGAPVNEAPLQLGRLLVILGVVLVGVGVALMFGSRFPALNLGKLPGDIAYKGKKVSFYFPIVTCLAISIFLTLILWLLSYVSRK